MPENAVADPPKPDVDDTRAAIRAGLEARAKIPSPGDSPKPPAAPTEPPKAEPKPATVPPTPPPTSPAAEEPKTNKQLRDAHEALVAKHNEAQSKLKQMEESGTATAKQIAAQESRIKAMDEELGRWRSQEPKWKELEKAHEEALEKLRITDYTQHPEFHEKYVRPVASAMAQAVDLVGQMVVEGEDRAGTKADFEAVLRAPNLTEATRRAKELFGADLAPAAIQQRNNVLAAERARNEAFQSAALRSKEALERQAAEHANAEAKLRESFEAASKATLEADPTLYRANPEDTDKEARAAYDEAADTADKLLTGQNQWSDGERIQKLAVARHRIASYPVAQLKVKRLEAKVAELTEQLKAFQRSEPDGEPAQRTGDSPPVDKDDLRGQMRRDLEKLAAAKKR